MRAAHLVLAANLVLAATGVVACTSEPAPQAKAAPAPRPDIVPFTPGGDARSAVVAARSKAEAEGRTLLVYVGAPWCEPCTRFHDALVAGKLDADLAGLRFLELDHDVHGGAIAELDCVSGMIPLFSVPDGDGRCTASRVEGGIKGEGAVPRLVPQVRALVPSK